MSLFNRSSSPKGKKIIGESMAPGENITLEINNFVKGGKKVVEKPSEEQVRAALQGFFEDKDGFLILTLPLAEHDVRYIQCAHDSSGKIEVEAGVEVRKGIKLVYRLFDEKETRQVFEWFFLTGEVRQLNRYKPVLAKA